MSDIKYRIGLGTVGPGAAGRNDITASRPIEDSRVFTADKSKDGFPIGFDFTADSTYYSADGAKQI